MTKDEIVTIRTFSSPQEANIYKSILENSGIVSSLKGEIIHDLMPFGQLTDIELQVAAADLGRAEEILAAAFDKKELDREK